MHDNAHWSAYGQSGISIAASVNFDNAPGPHIIVSGNTSVNNAELVPEYRANAITDGEGIILDSNHGYTGGFLVQNNTTHGNSGPGIEALGSDNAVITGNTTTGDLTNPNLASEGEIFNNQSQTSPSPTITSAFLHRPRRLRANLSSMEDLRPATSVAGHRAEMLASLVATRNSSSPKPPTPVITRQVSARCLLMERSVRT